MSLHRAASRPLAILGMLAALTVLRPVAAGAASGAAVPVQGLLASEGGGPVADASYPLTLRLYTSPTATLDEAVWKEIHVAVKVKGGAFTLIAGTKDANYPFPEEIFAAQTPGFLGAQVAEEPELPRVALGHVPLAIYARTAGKLAGKLDGSQVANGTLGPNALAFTYAGSDVKGGPASTALVADQAKAADEATHAKNADAAKLADDATHAKNADAAKLADDATHAKNADAAIFADKSMVSDLAMDLLCTGCVPLAALSAQAVAAFVPSAGGKITGNLEVTDTLSAGKLVNLGSATLSGGRYAAQNVKNEPCDANTRGRVLFDDATGRLHLCDGKAWVRLAVCSTACKDAALVACGAPVGDECGDTGGCTGKGTLCGPNFACKADKCEPTLACDAAVGKKAILTASTSWKVPGDVTTVRVMVVGGGGGGGQGHANGAGSGHVRRGTFSVTPCASVTITIGSGGSGGSGNGSGANGGSSSFGSFLSASYGSGVGYCSSGGNGGSGGGGLGNSGGGGAGGKNGANGNAGASAQGGSGGNFEDVVTGYFNKAVITAGNGGTAGVSSHGGGGGGGGVLVDGSGTGGAGGAYGWSGGGGQGYGGGGGAGGYTNNGSIYAPGGTGGAGVVYIEWD